MKTLREAREERGIKQKTVAEALNITRQTYAKHEAHPERMPINLAEAACAFIGCSPNDIFFGNKLS